MPTSTDHDHDHDASRIVRAHVVDHAPDARALDVDGNHDENPGEPPAPGNINSTPDMSIAECIGSLADPSASVKQHTLRLLDRKNRNDM